MNLEKMRQEFEALQKQIAEYQTWGSTRIPRYMAEPLARYLVYHCPVGDFLTAVLRNDLRVAISRADDNNITAIPAYISFLHNEAPGTSWGSPEAVKKWTDKYEEIQNAQAGARVDTLIENEDHS